MNLKVTVEGADKVIINLNKFKKQTSKELKLAMRNITLKIRRDAKGNAPVATGFLKGNIVFKVKSLRQGVEGLIWSKAPYSVYQEFGTSRHVAQPFMEPAFTGNIPFIKQQLKVAIVSAMLFSSKKV